MLQAAGLRRAERLVSAGGPNTFAVALFEGCAGRTACVVNSSRPKWDAGSAARAFRLPIAHPCSRLYLALIDDQSGTHEPLGRVVVCVGGVHPQTC